MLPSLSADDDDPDVDVGVVVVVLLNDEVVLVVDVAVLSEVFVVFVVVERLLVLSNSWSFPLLKINWLGIFDNNFSILLKTLL